MSSSSASSDMGSLAGAIERSSRTCMEQVNIDCLRLIIRWHNFAPCLGWALVGEVPVTLSLFDFLTPIRGPIFRGGPVDDFWGGILQMSRRTSC